MKPKNGCSNPNSLIQTDSYNFLYQKHDAGTFVTWLLTH